MMSLNRWECFRRWPTLWCFLDTLCGCKIKPFCDRHDRELHR